MHGQRGTAHAPHARRRGFTLVELLVVIAIIGLLIAILLPAVQGFRETGRRTQCLNNLAQFAKAFNAHMDMHQTFPSGGWGVRWVGDADRGFGPDQPGGWVYSVLPYIDQKPLWEKPGDGQVGVVTATQRTQAMELVQTPLPILHCPSRRAATLYPVPNSSVAGNNFTTPTSAARSDYCASAGSRTTCVGSAAPSSLPEPAPDSTSWMLNSTAGFNGAVYQRSRVSAALVNRDGQSNTLVVGEKYLTPTAYATGLDNSDNESAYVGDDRDSLCNCSGPNDRPLQDTIGIGNRFHFGSAHSQVSGYAFADTNTRSLSYDIDPEILRRLVVVGDGLVVQLDP